MLADAYCTDWSAKKFFRAIVIASFLCLLENNAGDQHCGEFPQVKSPFHVVDVAGTGECRVDFWE